MKFLEEVGLGQEKSS